MPEEASQEDFSTYNNNQLKYSEDLKHAQNKLIRIQIGRLGLRLSIGKCLTSFNAAAKPLNLNPI